MTRAEGLRAVWQHYPDVQIPDVSKTLKSETKRLQCDMKEKGLRKGRIRGDRTRVRCGAEEGGHKQQQAQVAVDSVQAVRALAVQVLGITRAKNQAPFQPFPQGMLLT